MDNAPATRTTISALLADDDGLAEIVEASDHLARALGYPLDPDENGVPTGPHYCVGEHTIATLAAEAARAIAELKARADDTYANCYAEVNLLHAEQLSRLFCDLGWEAVGTGSVRPMRLDDATDSLDKVYDEIAAAARKKLALVVKRARAEGAAEIQSADAA